MSHQILWILCFARNSADHYDSDQCHAKVSFNYILSIYVHKFIVIVLLLIIELSICYCQANICSNNSYCNLFLLQIKCLLYTLYMDYGDKFPKCFMIGIHALYVKF
jgi:hypothetical protein